MTEVDELAKTLEAHLMPGRIGDALDLAMVLDSFITERVAEGVRLLEALKQDAQPEQPK
jgi:hypothetical protein